MRELNIEYIDISPLLEKAAAALPTDKGTVIHGEAFSLFEAMSAVEIGNPKMDVGMLAAPKTLDQLIADGAAPADLSPEQRLEVMERLLQMEATWQTGGSLAQTVFSCLYMLRTARIAHDVCLHAYCMAVCRSCSLIRYIIMQGGVVEEEDCNIHMFGLPLNEYQPAITPSVEEVQCFLQLETAIAFCHTMVEKPEKEGHHVVWTATRDLLSAKKDMIKGMDSILRRGKPDITSALQHFSKALSTLQQKDGSVPDTKMTEGCTSTSASTSSPLNSKDGVQGEGMSKASTKSAEAAEHLGFDDSVNRNLVIPSPPRAIKVMSRLEARNYMLSLLKHLGQVLSITSVTSYEALHTFILNFSCLKAAPLSRSVAHYLLLPQSWGLPDPALASPPAQQTEQRDGTSPSTTPPADPADPADPVPEGSISPASSSPHPHPPTPAAATPDTSPSPSTDLSGSAPHFIVSNAMIATSCGIGVEEASSLGPDVMMFLEQSVIAVGNWCQAMLMNPCRTRRRLRKALGDWGNLFDHAINADFSPEFTAFMKRTGWSWPQETISGMPPPGPLGTWVERETAGSMLQHLLMGFQLELYEAKEYIMMYWYCDVLCNCQKTATKLLLDTPPPPPKQLSKAAPKLPARKSGGKKNGPSVTPPPPAASTTLQSDGPAQLAWEQRRLFLQRDMLRLERTHFMMSGCMKAMLGIKELGLVKAPQPPFNSMAQRFDQRFAAFHGAVVRPEPLTYVDFMASVDTTGFDASKLLQMASEAFTVVRQIVKHEMSSALAQQLPVDLMHLKDMDRVAGQNMLACGVLARASSQVEGAAQQPTMNVIYDFTLLQVFPALGVKSSK
ncbi:hypothetical protein CEUSTIGMA_g3458.t1 [Chlamydomonas eustigma]|uniref:Mak10 subunit, NatC N(Alpha)-terminal acetyltransferase n=1 Tax=Chlamydomonas eustigma TaxID=1157962 RepID=A0A250WZ05_9CHLO|nr:hypothetical protein CEUSTIGMA_g3458.t1 [Chlamydomonas eustigma]|eukprot:GAX76015.1 hypothetical protein CEUSTIGMA_g3458.t1 [Chlamydomonas eustigma]